MTRDRKEQYAMATDVKMSGAFAPATVGTS